MKMKHDCLYHLTQNGIALDDAVALRRISMTLHRWHELECGDSNEYASWCMVRGKKVGYTFEYDEDNGKPYLEVHPHASFAKTRYDSVPDRERGALKRLAKIMARYPGFASYVQGDPRGASLYILRPEDQNGLQHGTTDFSSCYTRGIAVYK